MTSSDFAPARQRDSPAIGGGIGRAARPGVTGRPPVRSSPLARRRATELAIALSKIQGTGPVGAIVEHDVLASAPSGEGTPAPARAAQTTVSGASSAAEWDHRAFLWWPDDGLVAVPASAYGPEPFEGLIGFTVEYAW